MPKKKSKKMDEETIEEGNDLCPRCGSIMVEEDGKKFCPDCEGEIDFFGEDDD